MVETKTYPVRSIDGKIIMNDSWKKMLIVYKNQMALIPFVELKVDGVIKIKML